MPGDSFAFDFLSLASSSSQTHKDLDHEAD